MPSKVMVSFDTSKVQLKLQAISKHAAALADELEQIDNGNSCSECGSYDVRTEEFYAGDRTVAKSTVCMKCGFEENESIE